MCTKLASFARSRTIRANEIASDLSKELGVLILNSRTQLYLLLVLQEDYNDMFRPYMWAIFRL